MSELKLKRSMWLVLLLYPIASVYAHLEPTYYLEGSFGERKVGVQIDHFAEAVYLKYFYQDDKYNTILKGDLDAGVFQFHGYEKEGLSQQYIQLVHLDDESWKGMLVEQSDTIQIFLTPIDKTLVSHVSKSEELNSTMSAYGYLRTSDLRFEEVKTERRKGYKLKWFKEPISGLTAFRVVDRGDKTLTAKLNEKLESLHLIQVEHFFECGTYGFRGSYSLDFEIVFLNEDFISYKMEVQSGCFSERVSRHSTYMTLKVSSGDEKSLEDLIFFGEGQPPKENSPEWFKYRRNEFASTVIGLLKDSHPDAFLSDEACDFQKIEAWQHPIWYLTSKGLYLGANFPGVNKACNNQDWSVITYQQLEEYFVDELIP